MEVLDFNQNSQPGSLNLILTSSQMDMLRKSILAATGYRGSMTSQTIQSCWVVSESRAICCLYKTAANSCSRRTGLIPSSGSQGLNSFGWPTREDYYSSIICSFQKLVRVLTDDMVFVLNWSSCGTCLILFSFINPIAVLYAWKTGLGIDFQTEQVPKLAAYWQHTGNIKEHVANLRMHFNKAKKTKTESQVVWNRCCCSLLIEFTISYSSSLQKVGEYGLQCLLKRMEKCCSIQKLMCFTCLSWLNDTRVPPAERLRL